MSARTFRRILYRLFGTPSPKDKVAMAVKRVAATAMDPEPKSAGRSTCLIVSSSADRDKAMLATVRSAGMQVQEVTRIEAETVARHRPDLVISAADSSNEILEIIRSLQELSYEGVIQPVGKALPDDLRPSNSGQLKVLPPLSTPVDGDALRQVLDNEGLARSPSGQVSVLLSSVLENKWLVFAYQPKVCLRSMTLTGAEIFARARHPVHGVLLPSAFLPHSTSQDLRRLGLASIRTALKSWEPFFRLGFNLRMSVNIPLEALEVDEITNIARSLRPSDTRWPGFTVEVETSECLAAADEIRDFSERARFSEIALALDNFGTGASMTTDLSNIGISEIKLHPSIVQKANENRARQFACRAAVDLARAYRSSVTCNAVESLEEMKFLRSLGCDAAQGRVFSPALDKVGFAALLRSKVSSRVA